MQESSTNFALEQHFCRNPRLRNFGPCEKGGFLEFWDFPCFGADLPQKGSLVGLEGFLGGICLKKLRFRILGGFAGNFPVPVGKKSPNFLILAYS